MLFFGSDIHVYPTDFGVTLTHEDSSDLCETIPYSDKFGRTESDELEPEYLGFSYEQLEESSDIESNLLSGSIGFIKLATRSATNKESFR